VRGLERLRKHALADKLIDGKAGAAPRHVWLCADDYGISSGVDNAIRELVMRGRLNATSVMVAAPSFSRSEAAALAILNAAGRRAAIGLHVTLTAPFMPLSQGYRPLEDGAFLSLGATLQRSLLRRLDQDALLAEVEAQLGKFADAFGRPPDFVDGHQHVQIFPQVREAVLAAVKKAAPQAWMRQCGRRVPFSRRYGDSKAMLLDVLSRGFRRRAAALDVRTNPAFAGTYSYTAKADFARLFPAFLDRLPEGSVVMCHPGFVDAELARLDPLTSLREQEYAFFASDAFPTLLTAKGVTLACEG
jgi:predicted glycoside hydrolase/deacetylase ChbG (UPF0249 family)